MRRVNTLLILFFLFATRVALSAVANLDTIAFFRVIQDQETYIRNPGNYDRITLRDSTGKHDYYTERQPAYIIPKVAIESIIVRKTKVVFGTRPRSKSKDSADIPSRHHNVTFKISSPEGKNFSMFTEKNKEDYFQMQIGGRPYNVQKFDLPFEANESGSIDVTLYLLGDDGDDLNKILSVFKDKVTWE